VPESVDDRRWYIFIHQLPPRPLYLRAKVRNLLSRAGAIALRDAVYLLPLREALLPELRRTAAVAVTGGGEAYVGLTEFDERPSHEDLVEAFRRARDEDYRTLAAQVRKWAAKLDRRSGTSAPEGQFRARSTHAKRRLDQIIRIDFFEAHGRAEAEAALANLDARLRPGSSEATRAHAMDRELLGRTWVTRRGIQVDRIASAWLVRRFIDPRARFRFIDPHGEEPRAGELRFDMVAGDFTHEEDRCTFETLVLRTGIKDPALARVAEIVHEIDIKDGKYACPEKTGVQQMLGGMLMATPDDESRLDRGFAMFDDLYQSFHRGLPAPAAGRVSREAHPPKGGRT
jgi:hypothetical protein